MSGPSLESAHNAVIPLGERDAGIFIPDSWEKLNLPNASDNVVMMARNGSENLVVSFENNASSTTGDSICDGAKHGFDPFEVVTTSDDECRFRGRVSINTPMREFWQKMVRATDSDNFLLASCSKEVSSSVISGCEEIIYSFGILDKK